MARHTHKPNIPPGELGRLEEGMPRNSDEDFSIENDLKEMRRRERKAVGLRD